MLNPQNSHEKKLGTHEIPTRKKLRPTKYPLKKLGSHKLPTTKTEDPRNTHEKKLMIHELPTKARWHDGTRPTRHTMAHNPLKVAHSYMGKYVGNVTRKQNSISYSGEELTELYKE